MDLFGRKKKAPPPIPLSQSIQQLRDAQVSTAPQQHSHSYSPPLTHNPPHHTCLHTLTACMICVLCLQTMLEKREKHIEKQSAACRDEAKAKLRSKDKRGALFLIKRAKLYDAQITQIYGKRSNLDIQIMALEGAASNSEIFKVMNVGRQALKQATASVDVDVVGDLMEDLNESLQANEEINDALAQQIGPQMDEDELNAELEEMEQELVDKVRAITATQPSTAHVPSSETRTPTHFIPPGVCCVLQDLLAVGAMPQPTAVQQQQRREKESVREEKAATITPSVPPRPLVSASGSVAPVNGSTSGPAAGGAGRKPHQLDDKEARELKELEALMNS